MKKFTRMLALASMIVAPYLGISRADPALEIPAVPVVPRVVRVDNSSWQVSAGYSRGFDNVFAEKTTFENSPEQVHNLSAGFNMAEVGVSKELENLFGFRLGAEGFYGKAADSKNNLPSQGTGGLEGTADSDLDASAMGVGAYIGKEFKFLSDRVGVGVKAGVKTGYVNSELTGRGYVASPGGDFAVGNTLEAKAAGFVAAADLGANASVYLGRDDRFRIFGEAGYRFGTSQDYDETKTNVRISAFGKTVEGEGKGNTPSKVGLNGGYIGVGASYNF